MLKELIVLANNLDKKGYHDVSDQVDNMIIKFSSGTVTIPLGQDELVFPIPDDYYVWDTGGIRSEPNSFLVMLRSDSAGLVVDIDISTSDQNNSEALDHGASISTFTTNNEDHDGEVLEFYKQISLDPGFSKEDLSEAINNSLSYFVEAGSEERTNKALPQIINFVNKYIDVKLIGINKVRERVFESQRYYTEKDGYSWKFKDSADMLGIGPRWSVVENILKGKPGKFAEELIEKAVEEACSIFYPHRKLVQRNNFAKRDASFDFDSLSTLISKLFKSYDWSERPLAKKYIIKKVLDETLNETMKKVKFLGEVMNKEINGSGKVPEVVVSLAFEGADHFSQAFELYQYDME